CLTSLETLEHIFRDCPSVAGVWDDLQIIWPNDFSEISSQDWFCYVLVVSNITFSRQANIVHKVISYIMELDVEQERLPSCLIGVIRDNLGRVFGSQSVPTTFTTFAAKALACSHTVHLALDFGLQEVTIEGDPLTVIRKVRSPLHDALSIGAYIQNVKAMAPFDVVPEYASLAVDRDRQAIGVNEHGKGTCLLGLRGICRSELLGGFCTTGRYWSLLIPALRSSCQSSLVPFSLTLVAKYRSVFGS
ncbi:hypothetical protein Gotri_022581, partial [Gossypium trilobum]|nr:hypothetical protein [Gossypium trilobum]